MFAIYNAAYVDYLQNRTTTGQPFPLTGWFDNLWWMYRYGMNAWHAQRGIHTLWISAILFAFMTLNPMFVYWKIATKSARDFIAWSPGKPSNQISYYWAYPASNPAFLCVYVIFVLIRHASDKGERIDENKRDIENIGCLADDRSTDMETS